MELSGKFPVKLLCETTGILRSSFYSWKKRLSAPSDRIRNFVSNILLFQEYHLRFPSHGYRWLNAKLRLDTGLVLSDPYAHKCCKTAGIKSKAKHYRYKKPGEPARVFPNLLLSEMQIDGPLQCVVSDMTAFYMKGVYYELTLFMDLWNDELVAHSLSSKREKDPVQSFASARLFAPSWIPRSFEPIIPHGALLWSFSTDPEFCANSYSFIIISYYHQPR